MKIFILFLMSAMCYSKCLHQSAAKAVQESSIIVLATVFNTNFTNARVLTKKRLDDKSYFPKFKLSIDEVLKGEVPFKELQVNKMNLRFKRMISPNPLYKVKDNVQRVFLIKKISDDGVAQVLTSQCTPYVSKATVKQLLR